MTTQGGPAKMRLMAGVLMLVAAVMFAAIGFRSVPRNNLYVILGVVFAILAAASFRRARTS